MPYIFLYKKQDILPTTPYSLWSRNFSASATLSSCFESGPAFDFMVLIIPSVTNYNDKNDYTLPLLCGRQINLSKIEESCLLAIPKLHSPSLVENPLTFIQIIVWKSKKQTDGCTIDGWTKAQSSYDETKGV